MIVFLLKLSTAFSTQGLKSCFKPHKSVKNRWITRCITINTICKSTFLDKILQFVTYAQNLKNLAYFFVKRGVYSVFQIFNANSGYKPTIQRHNSSLCQKNKN